MSVKCGKCGCNLDRLSGNQVHYCQAPSSFAAPTGSALPLALTIRVSATNGSTLLRGIESVCKEFHVMRIPKRGEVFEGQFWRAEITECVDRLPNADISDGAKKL